LSIFEAIMILCFGLAWPFSIYKSYTSRQVAGKSILFLFTVFTGYISGVIHKITHSFDWITILYILNGTMIFIDILLYYRNKRLFREQPPR